MKRTIPGRWPLHSTRRPRRGEVQCRRAELSIGGLRRRRFVTTRAWMPWPACCVVRAHDCVPINGSERRERRCAALGFLFLGMVCAASPSTDEIRQDCRGFIRHANGDSDSMEKDKITGGCLFRVLTGE